MMMMMSQCSKPTLKQVQPVVQGCRLEQLQPAQWQHHCSSSTPQQQLLVDTWVKHHHHHHQKKKEQRLLALRHLLHLMMMKPWTSMQNRCVAGAKPVVCQGVLRPS
jgi:hypothetical protein